jgi:YVTN family beta-propeller protein
LAERRTGHAVRLFDDDDLAVREAAAWAFMVALAGGVRSVAGVRSHLLAIRSVRGCHVARTLCNTISVIDATTAVVVATIPVGGSPVRVAITPDAATVYVTNSTDGSVSLLDANTITVTATVPVGTQPYGLAFAIVSVLSVTTTSLPAATMGSAYSAS